jgi:ElaB/YqjD/DUF883 family membrane-anchored ribosome-binding protein
MTNAHKMNEFGEKVSEVEDAFTVGLSSLRDDISRLTQTVSELVRKEAESARSRVMDAVETARTQVSDSATAAQERVQTASADLESGIEKNPIASVFIALGIGVVLGLMARSSR